MWFLSFARRHVYVHVVKPGPSNLSVTLMSAQAKQYRLRINHTYNDKVHLSAILIENKWDAGCPQPLNLQPPTFPVSRCWRAGGYSHRLARLHWRLQSHSEGSFITVYTITHRSCRWRQTLGEFNVHVEKSPLPSGQADVSLQMSTNLSRRRLHRKDYFSVLSDPTLGN